MLSERSVRNVENGGTRIDVAGYLASAARGSRGGRSGCGGRRKLAAVAAHRDDKPALLYPQVLIILRLDELVAPAYYAGGGDIPVLGYSVIKLGIAGSLHDEVVGRGIAADRDRCDGVAVSGVDAAEEGADRAAAVEHRGGDAAGHGNVVSYGDVVIRQKLSPEARGVLAADLAVGNAVFKGASVAEAHEAARRSAHRVDGAVCPAVFNDEFCVYQVLGSKARVVAPGKADKSTCSGHGVDVKIGGTSGYCGLALPFKSGISLVPKGADETSDASACGFGGGKLDGSGSRRSLDRYLRGIVSVRCYRADETAYVKRSARSAYIDSARSAVVEVRQSDVSDEASDIVKVGRSARSPDLDPAHRAGIGVV